MLATRSFFRFRKIGRNRFPGDTHIRYNEVYIEGICKELKLLSDTKKENAAEFKRWVDSAEKYIPYWVAKFRPKENY